MHSAPATAALPPIAFIGGGNMGTAMADALARTPQPPAISVCDPVAAIRGRHASAGRKVSDQIAPVVHGAGIVVLAVKPQVAGEALAALAPVLNVTTQIVVTILAGTTTARIEAALPKGARVLRAMPNTPMAIGLGMVGLCKGTAASDADLAQAERIFTPAAKVLRVSEDRLDAITAVSGSGPAYLFRFAEALHAGAQQLGFSASDAALLVGQTLRGSVEYLLAQDGFPAAQLRQNVTSPGGTTAAALKVMDDAKLVDVIARALAAAESRAKELAKG